MKCLPGILLCMLAALPVRAAEPLDVVVSFSILADVVQEVGGELVHVRALVGPGGDAHVYRPKPSDLAAVTSAQMFVLHGLGFDPWAERLVRAAGFRGRLVVVSDGVSALRDEGGLDPHTWQDPRNVVHYVRHVADALVALRPEHSAQLRERAARYAARLQRLHAEFAQRLARIPAPRRRFITAHDAFGYLAHAYDLTVLAPQGWSTHSQPSARVTAAIVAQLRAQQVRAVFVENVADRRFIEMLAREAGAVVGGRLYSDALAPPGHAADSYEGLMRHNLQLLESVLGAEE